jgi:hypothetical protein
LKSSKISFFVLSKCYISTASLVPGLYLLSQLSAPSWEVGDTGSCILGVGVQVDMMAVAFLRMVKGVIEDNKGYPLASVVAYPS